MREQLAIQVARIYERATNETLDLLRSIPTEQHVAVSYTFDAVNRLTGAADWGSRTTTYAYDAASLLSGVTNANTSTVSYSYDDAQRLLTTNNRKSDNTVISAYAFTLDKVGNRTASNQTEPLTQGTAVAGTTGHSYDAANQLVNAGATTFTFDNNGNQKTQVSGSVTINYGYDFEDRLKSVADGTTSVQYVYNGVGQRLARTVNGTTTRFVIDPTSRLPRLLAETDAGGNITAYYTHGLGLIAKVAPAGQSYQYHLDARGSTIAMTDSGQTVVNKYAYDPFGTVTASAEVQTNPFKYIGQFGVQAEPFDLLFAARRYYQASLGRFLTKDPAAPSMSNSQALNQYVYSLNNPIILIDPSGLTGEMDGKVLGTPTGSSDQSHNVLLVADPYGQTFIGSAPKTNDWETFEESGFTYRARQLKQWNELTGLEKSKLIRHIIIRNFTRFPVIGIPNHVFNPLDFIQLLDSGDPRYEIDPNSFRPKIFPVELRNDVWI